MDITHHGPVIALFSVQLQQLFSYVRGVLVTNRFSRLLIDRYILAIQQIITHKEHLWYSFWSVAIFWTSSEALAPYSSQQKLAQTVSSHFYWAVPSKSRHFWQFWCMLCTATPDISSSSENVTSAVHVSRLSFHFLWLWLYWVTM